MAAQALTKERFVQIIITLTVLVSAFTWRTFNHSQVQLVDCQNQKLCTFNVKNIALEARFTQKALKLGVNDPNVSISSELKAINSVDGQPEWELPRQQENPIISLAITLENNDMYRVNITNYPQ